MDHVISKANIFPSFQMFIYVTSMQLFNKLVSHETGDTFRLWDHHDV